MKQVMTPTDLIEWLRSKPLDTTYNYFDNSDCVLFRYLTDRGMKPLTVSGFCWRDQHGIDHEIPEDIIVAASGKGAAAVENGPNGLQLISTYRDVLVELSRATGQLPIHEYAA